MRCRLDKDFPLLAAPKPEAPPKPPPLPTNRLADEKTLNLFLALVASRVGQGPIRARLSDSAAYAFNETLSPTTLGPCLHVFATRELVLSPRKLKRSERWQWAIHVAAHQMQMHRGGALKHSGKGNHFPQSLAEAKALFRQFWEEVIEQPDLVLGAEHIAFLEKRHNRKARKHGEQEPAGQ